MSPSLSSFVLLLFFSTTNLNLSQASSYDYGMVIDAGSTHSAIYIYKWNHRSSKTSEGPQTSPSQESSFSKKSGIAGCCTSEEEIREYLFPLLNFTQFELKNEKNSWNTYPIYLKATAGMRILPTSQRVQILGWIRQALNNQTFNPYYFKDNQAVIISGEEEATFGWMSVNFLLGAFQNYATDGNRAVPFLTTFPPFWQRRFPFSPAFLPEQRTQKTLTKKV